MHETEKPKGSGNVDFNELLLRVDNDRELLLELLTIFKEDFPQHLQALREAVAKADAKTVAATGHILKGMLSNLAATRAAGLAARIELSGKEGQTQNLNQLLSEFELEAGSLLSQLQAYVAEVQP